MFSDLDAAVSDGAFIKINRRASLEVNSIEFEMA
jgi:hypothetical protein